MEEVQLYMRVFFRLDCEVCQAPLPKRIEINGKCLDLADIERPEEPYIILESISKEKMVSKGLVLIKSPFEEPIKLVIQSVYDRVEVINARSVFPISQCPGCMRSLSLRMGNSS